MPATLSAIAPVEAATGAAATGARLAHAAQVVVPSAICAPHMLQNAIEKTLRSDETSPLDRPPTYAPSSVRGKVSKRSCQSNGQIPEIAGNARQKWTEST